MKGKYKYLGRTVPHRVKLYVHVHAHVYVSKLRKLPVVIQVPCSTQSDFSVRRF